MFEELLGSRTLFWLHLFQSFVSAGHWDLAYAPYQYRPLADGTTKGNWMTWLEMVELLVDLLVLLLLVVFVVMKKILKIQDLGERLKCGCSFLAKPSQTHTCNFSTDILSTYRNWHAQRSKPNQVVLVRKGSFDVFWFHLGWWSPKWGICWWQHSVKLRLKQSAGVGCVMWVSSL